MAGGTRSARTTPLRSSYRLLLPSILALLLLLLIVAVSLFTSTTTSSSSPDSHTAGASELASSSLLLLPHSSSGPFLALKSDPLRTRLDLIQRQALDHIALVNAYSSYSRRLKLDNAHLLRSFDDLSSSFSDVLSRLDASSDDPERQLDEETLRSFEKEIKDRVKLARLLISDSKESFDTQLKIQKLRDTIFAVNEQLHRAKKLGDLSSTIAAGSTPKSLHCLSMKLVEEMVSDPKPYAAYFKKASRDPALENPDLHHYAVFSDNVIAVSVVLNSVIRNSREPRKLVFHLVTEAMNLAAFQVWFRNRSHAIFPAHVEIRSMEDFRFLNSSYAPIVRVVNEGGRYDISVLEHLKFYLPEMYPKLRRIVYLEDDVVVQKDLGGLWRLDLDGKVNGAVETCFGPFKRYSRYMNLTSPLIRKRFSAKACAWAFGVNVFDLDAWRRERCTEDYHELLNLNKDGSLWKVEETLPVGLATFYMNTKPLEKRWHLLGLGYNPSISDIEISKAAVVHFNGKMKPWLDIAMNQYKHLWMKYVDSDVEYLQSCNFGT